MRTKSSDELTLLEVFIATQKTRAFTNKYLLGFQVYDTINNGKINVSMCDKEY